MEISLATEHDIHGMKPFLTQLYRVELWAWQCHWVRDRVMTTAH